MLTLKWALLLIAVAGLHMASARFQHEQTREKFVGELTKKLQFALEKNQGRKNFDVFRTIVMRYEFDCKRHAINKVIQAHMSGEKERIAEIEKYYGSERFKDFADQSSFKFATPTDIAAVNKRSVDTAKKTVKLCANMEAISAGEGPNIQ